MELKGETAVRRLLVWGACMIGFGVVGFVVLILGGILGGNLSNLLLSSVPAVVGVAGIVVVGIGVGLGLMRSRIDASGPARRVSGSIESRFAMNELGEMIFGDFIENAPGGSLHIRFTRDDGRVEEYRTSWEVFLACGEGMKGHAGVKGAWLASFEPYPRFAAAAEAPRRLE